MATFDSCDRLLKRSVASGNERRASDVRNRTINGTCTQVEKFVPEQIKLPTQTINVTSPEIKVPPTQVRVIVRDPK